VPTPILLIAPAAGLLIDIALQAILPRLSPHSGPIRLQFISFAAGAGLTLALVIAMLGTSSLTLADRAGYLVLHALIYGCAGFFFFNVISANVSSLRVRIVREMLAKHPTPLADTTLRERYSAREMISMRLERLHRGGQIERREGRYFLRKRGLRVVSGVFTTLRGLLLAS
jgi:hypothetical protein